MRVFCWNVSDAANVILNDRVFAKTKTYDLHRGRIFYGRIVS